jgi:hypothetical protein
MQSPFGALCVPQDRETPPRWQQGAGFRWRYAYARAAETQAMNEVGQDCIVVEPRQDGLIFALTDGVSQSFYGDLAAAALSRALVKWLATTSLPLDPPSVSASLAGLLQRLRADVSEEVQNFPLPKELPAMLQEVLEKKRSMGSESMYVCGRLWCPSAQHPQGHLLLSWLGDMRCRLWRGAFEEPVPGEFRTEHRWSSVRGVVSAVPQFVSSDLRDRVTRVMVYSDGLASLDPLAEPPDDQALLSAIEEAGRSPTSDDISFLDVVLEPS